MSSQPSSSLGTHSSMGFNGQLHEAGSRWQLLGNGYRAYNPALMRFQSTDDRSPFREGGVNAYTYCQGSPTNFMDPSGHRAVWMLPAAFGVGAIGLIVGAAVSKDSPVKAVLGALAAVAVVGVIATFPFRSGTVVSRIFSRGGPGSGQAMRPGWKPASSGSSTSLSSSGMGTSISNGIPDGLPQPWRRHSAPGAPAGARAVPGRDARVMDDPWLATQSAPTTPRNTRARGNRSPMPFETGSVGGSSTGWSGSSSLLSTGGSSRSSGASGTASLASESELDGIARWLMQQRKVRAVS